MFPGLALYGVSEQTTEMLIYQQVFEKLLLGFGLKLL